MLIRIRGRVGDEGFTLVELLVVMIIIGILAGIAIAALLSQRKSAVDASMKSDLRNTATVVEGYRAANAEYPDDIADIAGDLRVDGDTVLTLTVDGGGEAFCLVAARRPGAPAGTGPWSYDSDGGGPLSAHQPCT